MFKRKRTQSSFAIRAMALGGALILLVALARWSISVAPAAPQSSLLSASFDAGTDGFAFVDDAFGTSQPNYASGARVATGGFGGTGGVQVSLGGVDANTITNMSGGWGMTLNLAADETGVTLSFRYRLDQSATYEFDEYTRMLVSVDGVQYGRGSKSYVDHIGGDGSSSLGNSSTFLPTTDWQQHQIFLGTLAAGSHTIILGGFNNKKTSVDKSCTVTIDDVSLTSGNSAPAVSDRQAIVNRLSSAEFVSNLQGLTSFGDRCRLSSCPGSPPNSYFDAQAWVASQLTAAGYTVQYHTSALSGGISNLYVTKVGTVNPGQMYIVSAHLDGRGGGAAYDDDGSGSALVLTAAKAFAAADVQTDTSVRFIFWDREEAGLLGSSAYVQERRTLQGTPGEPTWLGIIQHDMILYDHGAVTPSAEQSPYADLDVEWRSGTGAESQSRALALQWRFNNGTYCAQYPSTAYDFSTNTDDTPFQPYVAAISVRENRRNLTSGSNAEWINPNYHTATDVASSYSALDLNLGFNALQGTVGTVAELVNARLVTPNNPPTANAQSLTTLEDVSLAVTLSGSDPENDPLTFAIVTTPAHGNLTGTAPNLTYNPASNYNGPDSFTFKVNDGRADSSPAAISLNVTPVNDPPAADAQSVTMNQNSSQNIVLTGSDIDGDALSFSILNPPAHGALSGTAPNLTYTPIANYSGADSFTFKVNDGTVDSAPAAVSITVLTTTIATNTTATSAPNPSTFGQLVTFTSTTSSSGIPGGSVTYTEGATVLAANVAVDGAGRASFNTAALGAGSHTITASFSGSGGWSNSSGNAPAQVVNKAATSTALSSSATSTVFSQPVTFTAIVTATAPGSGVPAGTVTFKAGTTTLGSGTLDGSGRAALTTSTLAVGTASITASYGGSTNHNSSTSSSWSQNVTKASTTTALTSSANPTVYSQPVTFSATVTAVAPASGIPTGTVTFKNGGTTLGTATLDGSGRASLTTSALSVGSASITASYGGSTGFNSSSSSNLNQTVNKVATSTAVTSSRNPSLRNQSVTFTATVLANAPGTATPTGSVTFKDGTKNLGSSNLNSSGQATLNISNLARGTHQITAVYGGSSNFLGSTSPPLTQTVN